MTKASEEPDEDLPGCPVCGGTGLIMGVAEGVPIAVPCQCTWEGRPGVLWRPVPKQ